MLGYFRKNILLVAVIILLFILYLPNLSKPFIGHHDWNTVVYSMVARNYVRYGFLTTKFGQVRNPDTIDASQFSYITHYPPLLPMMMSVFFRVFGETAWAARLVSVLASVFLVWGIYEVGKVLFNRDTGFLAALFASISPMLLYFGLIPVHETLVPAFSIWTVWAYMQFLKTNRSKYFWISCVLIILGGLTNRSAFYIVPPIIIHYWIFGQKEFRAKITGLFFVCVALFFLHLIHLKILTGTLVPGELVAKFFERANPSLTREIYGYSLPKYLVQETRYFKIFYSTPVFLLAAAGVFLLSLQLVLRKMSWQHGILLALLAYGAVQLVLFRQLVFIHDYMIHYATPFVVLAAAWFLVTVFSFLPKSWHRMALVSFLLLWSIVGSHKLTEAFVATNMNERGLLVGEFIRARTSSGEKAFVSSLSYKEFQEVFVRYYADREVGFGETLPPDWQAYRLIIIPKDHAALPDEEKAFLAEQIPTQESEYFFWYDLYDASLAID